MCTNKNNFAARETQYYAGDALLGKTTADIVTVSAEKYKTIFPDAVSGWSYDFNKTTALRDGKTYRYGVVNGSAREITRMVLFAQTINPTKCDARCRNARGPMCDCSCRGNNHGKGAGSFARAHNISLPSTKRKLNIDEATSALSSMGYRMGNVRHSLADKTSYWSVTTPTGSVVEVAANKLTDFVYGKIKNLNAQRYTETTYEVLFPDEDEDTQFIDSKEAAIKVARQYAAKGCAVELSQVIKTWRSKAEADAAQIPTNTKETPMRFVKNLNAKGTTMKSINKRLSSMVINELNHALEMAEMDGEQGIAREVRAVLASPTVETLKAHPLAIKEIKYKLEIAQDNEERSRVRAYENLLKSVSNRKAQNMNSTGARAKFGSDTISVNMNAKRYLTILNRVKPDEGQEQFLARVKARLQEVVNDTGKMIRNPDLESELGGWQGSELSEILSELAGSSSGLIRTLRLWLGNFSRTGAKSRFAMLNKAEVLKDHKERVVWLKQHAGQSNQLRLADIYLEAGQGDLNQLVSQKQMDKTEWKTLMHELETAYLRVKHGADAQTHTSYSRVGAKARFDRRIELDKWTSPKGTRYTAGFHIEGGGTSFAPFVSATYSDGGEQMMSTSAPSFKSEKGARKWLANFMERMYSRTGTFSRVGAKSTHAVNPFDLPAKPEDWNGKTITLNGKQIKVKRTTGAYSSWLDYDLFDLSSGKRVNSVVKAQLDDAWRRGKIRDIFSRTGKTSMAQSDFKVGDQVHLGFAQKGGTGFDGIITKIEGETVYIKSPEEGRYGARTYKGLVSSLTHGYAGYHADQHSRTGAKSLHATTDQVADLFKTLSDVERASMNGDTAKMQTLLKSLAPMVDRDRAKLPKDAVAYYDEMRRKAGMSRIGSKANMNKLTNHLQKISASLGFKPSSITMEDGVAKINFAQRDGSSGRLGVSLRKPLLDAGVTSDAITATADQVSINFSQGAKAAFGSGDSFMVEGYVGNALTGGRSARTIEEAEHYAKAMLASIKSGKTDGKPVKVEIQEIKDYQPQGVIKTLHSRTGGKAAFGLGSQNRAFLGKVDARTRSEILANIAAHYGISASEAMAEVSSDESEHLLEYVTGAMRSAVSILVQKYGFSRTGAKAAFAAEIIQKLSGGWVIEREGGILYLAKGNEAIPVPSVERALELHKSSVEGRLARRTGGFMSRTGAKAAFAHANQQIADGVAQLLSVLGFAAMAEEAKTTTDADTLKRMINVARRRAKGSEQADRFNTLADKLERMLMSRSGGKAESGR